MRLSWLIIALFLFSFWACDDSKKETGDLKLKIVCTTGMLTDIVEDLVGEQAEVVGLMGPGVDPHLYKATQGDLKDLGSADIIIYNGLHLEGKMGEIFEKLANRKTILIGADAIEEQDLLNNTDYPGTYDPHLWFDVSLWTEVTNYLALELIKNSHLDSALIETNKQAINKDLEELDNWIKVEIARIDSHKRVLITAHDAFGYFGKAYNIEVKGLQGISTLSEYGLKDVSNLVNYIVEKKIQAVFIESSVSDRALNAVIEGCKERGHEVTLGGTLFSDAMGAEDSPEGNYRGMVEYNVRTIVEALK